MSAGRNILRELKEQVLYLTINRPDKLNALNRETLEELAQQIEFAAHTQEVRGVLLTGAGEKAFVAGADISEFATLGPEDGEALARKGQEQVFDAISNCPKPVVAAINGFALGGGLELAMACHIRVASDQARFGLPEVTLGLIPGYGGTQRLAGLIGRGRAIEMITTAEMIGAEQAEKIGLVNYVVPGAELQTKAVSILDQIRSRAPLAVAAAIRAVNASGGREGFETEIREFGQCFGTADFREGVAAFLGKRKASFIGK